MNTRRTRVAALALAAGLLLAISGAAQASLHDRGGGLIYDDVLNVTWLQDADYAKTSGYSSDGSMTWGSAVTWAANLSYYDSVRNVTYTDWRLPTVRPVDGLSLNNIFRNDGASDAGFNISAQGTLYAGSTASEMAFMYYQNLGNPGYVAPDGTPNTTSCGYNGYNCLQNTGPFKNLNTDKYYWTGVEYGYDTSQAWLFGMNDGIQGAGYKTNSLNAWAVRDGDVTAVPEADTWAMLLVGITLIGLAKRRQTRSPKAWGKGVS